MGSRPRSRRAAPPARVGCGAAGLAAVGFLAVGGTLAAAPPASAQQEHRDPPTAVAAPDPARSFRLVNVTVIDVRDGTRLRDRAVTVVDGRIASLDSTPGPAGRPREPDGLATIDGGGGYVIPGLWDMHGHALPGAGGTAADWWEPDPETAFPLLLANGVTGLRDMWGTLEGIARVERQRRFRGTAMPRLLSPGGIVDGPVPYYPNLIAVTSTAEAVRAVDSLRAGGADFIKVYTSLPPALYRAVVDRAREVGLRVAGHVPAAVRAADAARAGHAAIEHLYGILEGCSIDEDRLLADEVRFLDARAAGRTDVRTDRAWFGRLLETQDADRCRALAEVLAREGVHLVPTLTAFEGVFRLRDPFAAEDPRLAYVDPRARSFWGPFNYDETRAFAARDWELRARRLRRLREVVGVMAASGVPVLAGTDFHPTIAFTFPGFSLHDELENLVEAGLSPLAALQAATWTAARFLEATDSLGVVAPGRLADFVLLAADPLERIGNTRGIRAVSLGGRWLPRDTLDAWLAGVESRHRDRVAARTAALPGGAVRTERWQGLRDGLEFLFLLDPVRGDGVEVPSFLEPLRAADLAGADPSVDALLRANPEFRDWLVSGLELLVADSARFGDAPPRRRAAARWWLAAVPADSAPALPAAAGGPGRILLGSWGDGSGRTGSVSVRVFRSGTRAFTLADLSLRLDLVCTPGGARGPLPRDPAETVVYWEADRVPHRYELETAAGLAGRDCDLRVSADGLHPLAPALRRAPFLPGPQFGARLVESGRRRAALYRID
ncbi:MAG: amidohydrolase family protein [Gemmatimonadota bacterium]|nr:amidohydrolase family protein [Gemmatimonadota bacterium]